MVLSVVLLSQPQKRPNSPANLIPNPDLQMPYQNIIAKFVPKWLLFMPLGAKQ